jgi:hypothetical protein
VWQAGVVKRDLHYPKPNQQLASKVEERFRQLRGLVSNFNI